MGMVLFGFVVLVGAGSCSGDGPKVAGHLKVTGRAEVGAPGEDIADVGGERAVRFGQRVRVREGSAVLTLGDGREIEFRPGSLVEIQSVGSGGDRKVMPSLLAGDLLITSPNTRLPVLAADTKVTVGGTARLSRGFSVTVGSYSGTVDVVSVGSSASFDALHQIVVPAAGVLPPRASPLEFSASDSWDRRLLGDAIELGNELLARSQGFSAQVPASLVGADFFRTLLPGLVDQPSFNAQILSAGRAPGETLVGSAIALVGTKGSFMDRWQAVFAFRDEGAPWGLVTLAQGVSRSPLLTDIDAAIGRGPGIFGGPLANDPKTGPGTGTPGIPTPRTQPGNPIGPTVPTTRPSGGTTPTTIPNPSPLPDPGPSPLNTGSPPLDNTVNSLVEALSGLLRALGL